MEMIDITDESEEGCYEFVLNLTINEAKIINNTTTTSSSSVAAYNWIPYQIYYVVAWISPENIIETPLKVAAPNPSWDLSYDILVDEPISIASLKLEVVRVGFQGEIGTSTGQVVVGRAQIPLSKTLKKRVRGFIDLVKFDGTECCFQGSIEVYLELENRRQPRSPPPPMYRSLQLAETGIEGIREIIEIIEEPQDYIQGDDRMRRRRGGPKN
ncbi:uncharacterized protein LOC122067126 isoform X2 [Macadamia integrifolia]|nr:uncharacterized protein LOC122067126 isoform X2 [Macadamia integrifolia]